jgi:hypothetical protein
MDTLNETAFETHQEHMLKHGNNCKCGAKIRCPEAAPMDKDKAQTYLRCKKQMKKEVKK